MPDRRPPEAGESGWNPAGRELAAAAGSPTSKSVNTNAARYQNLSINQSKLSGQCGRLKCCLNYELDTYMDAPALSSPKMPTALK